MRNILFTISIFALFTISCSTQKTVTTKTNKSQSTINNVVIDPDINREILLGYVNDEGLKNYTVFTNADVYYKEYNIDTSLAEIINKNSNDISIKVIFGSWCGDSKRNVPAFQKIVEVSNFDKSKIEYIAVNRKKKVGSVDIASLDIKRVPTFIFYRNDKEIGRIIENPTSETIEQDWVDIVAKK